VALAANAAILSGRVSGGGDLHINHARLRRQIIIGQQAAQIKNNRNANLLFAGAAVNLASFNFCDAAS